MREQHQIVEQIFSGNSEMAMLMRSLDWSQTPLGDVSGWSSSLKIAVSICLNSRFPMVIWWSKELVLLYNDAWRPILGTKHPKALGRPGKEVWAEIWDIIGVQLNSVLETAQATWSDDTLLLVDRYGYTEEAYFTYSYSPIFLETGEVGGAFTAVTETTRRVIGERRLSTLRELAANTVEAKSVEETCRIASATLANNPYDIPFALLYSIEQDGQQARLSGTVRVDAQTTAAPDLIDLCVSGDTADATLRDRWHLTQVKQTGEPEIVGELIGKFGMLSGGVWDDPAREAIVLPISQAGQKQQLAGLLVLGISPRLAFDDEYRGFFDLVATNVATALADAQAYEAERKRAEALAELDRAKTAFFSNVSHEFRTPLTLMLSPLEDTIANLNGIIPAQEREQLQLVQRNGMRLLKLVNSLLDFSRIEAGRVQASYEPTDLATYTAELASSFRSLIERVGMSLIVDCQTLPEEVYVDREMWEKIVLNLLSNAFKFTLQGTITVRLQWEQKCVKLNVSDTGVGIPPEELPHLFERFHRVENSQGRSFEGSGIGLSLVQELVKLHGGAIAVSSTFGIGSCFTVTIPTGTAHLPPERISASRTLASTALGAMPYIEEAQRWLPEGDFRLQISDFRLEDNPTNINPAPAAQAKIQNIKYKILLADDNADMRDYIRRLLSASYNVQTVGDGVAALNAIKNNPPDLVLTDVMMPGMDGFELLRNIRSNPQTQAIPIILLSARAGEESRIEGLAAGADDYLIKPFSARELIARIEATLKLSQLRQEALQREQVLRAMSETAQQQAESAARRIEQLLESMSEAFIALDKDWRIIYQNATAERINKKPRSEVLGKTLWEEWPAAVDSISDRHYRLAIAQQVAVHFEQHYYEPPDHDVWLEVHAYPFEEGLGIFYRDINHRKRAEAEREQLLAREKAAREAAETANRLKDEFLAVLSHELRSPLNPILGWSRLLQQGKVNAAKTQNALATIERNALLQSQLIEDLLDISRILRGKLSLNVMPVNLSTVISEALETVRLAAEAKSLQIQTTISPDVGAVMGDAARLQQVVWNLLSNAVKFTPSGGQVKVILKELQIEDVRLQIERELQIEDGRLQIERELQIEDGRLQIEDENNTSNLLSEISNLKLNKSEISNLKLNKSEILNLKSEIDYAQIQVIDNGKGIKREFLPYVFEHFRQEDGATTRKFGGLGLGLAIARQIVEMHGGTIAVDSPGEGQGATFTVLLPLAPNFSQPPLTERESASTDDLSGVRILVVDDEIDSREFVTYVLEQAGATVTSVSSGMEALQAIAQFVPSLIVSDIGMPEMDGYMLMRQIRSMERSKGIPAIALTAYAGEYDKRQAIAAGFQAHIAKPIDPDAAIAIVVQLIKRPSTTI